MSHTIYFDLFIEASPEELFDALSLPKHLINWWPKKCTGKRKIGATYNYFFGEPYDWYAEITALDINHLITFKMTISDEDWNPTSFSYELINENNKIRLKFQHSGWPENNGHFRFSAFCWAQLLNGLKNYVEKGEIIPFEKRN